MYLVEFKSQADKDLEKMDNALIKQFIKHVKKIELNPGKKHLKLGLPYFIEKVTDQARIAFFVENNTIYILRCFKNHKEYENWYKSEKV